MGHLHEAFAAAHQAREAQAAAADRCMRRAADRIDPPPVLSRADQIIAEGHERRIAYRKLTPGADTAMVYGVQIGYLHGMVRVLCNEAEALAAKRDPALRYLQVFCDELDCDVLVGFDYAPGEESKTWGPPEDCYEGSPEELTVCEVWLNGADIAAVLLERVAQQLTDAALAAVHDQQEQSRAADDEARAESRMAWAL